MRYSRLIANTQGAAPKTPDKGPVAAPEQYGERSHTVQRGTADALTAARMLNILRDAEGGDVYEQMVLFEAMDERDSTIGAHLQTRKLGLLSCGYDLMPADDSAEADRAKTLCEDVIKGIAHFEDRLFDTLDAVGKGFSVLEINWDSSEGHWWPTGFDFRPQRWFQVQANNDELRLRSISEPEGVAINPLNFLIHTHHARSGNLPRAGLLRGIARPYLIRNYGWKDWLALGELFGLPPRIGTLPDGATEEQKSTLWTAVKNLGSDYAAIISDGTKIEFPQISAVQGESVFERMISLAGKDLTLAILGQLLTSGGEGGGSYALGKVHERVRFDLIESDAKRSAETLTQQFLERIVRFNLGPEAPVPTWSWRIEQPEDLPQLATTVKTLRESGLRIGVKWIYNKFGIPEPEKDEEVLEAPAQVARPPFGGMSLNTLPNQGGKKNDRKPAPTSRSARYLD